LYIYPVRLNLPTCRLRSQVAIASGHCSQAALADFCSNKMATLFVESHRQTKPQNPGYASTTRPKRGLFGSLAKGPQDLLFHCRRTSFGHLLDIHHYLLHILSANTKHPRYTLNIQTCLPRSNFRQVSPVTVGD